MTIDLMVLIYVFLLIFVVTLIVAMIYLILILSDFRRISKQISIFIALIGSRSGITPLLAGIKKGMDVFFGGEKK